MTINQNNKTRSSDHISLYLPQPTYVLMRSNHYFCNSCTRLCNSLPNNLRNFLQLSLSSSIASLSHSLIQSTASHSSLALSIRYINSLFHAPLARKLPPLPIILFETGQLWHTRANAIIPQHPLVLCIFTKRLTHLFCTVRQAAFSDQI